jgi:glycosyltransferase involved in cell wall biosynthesis
MTGPFRILHVMRTPVGGLFRHVVDLAREQTARGHDVGLIADAATGSARADIVLADLGRTLTLGVTRIQMSRQIGLGDVHAIRHVSQRARDTGATILHGHGAKGGAFARLAQTGPSVARVYTPHGGSLHFERTSPIGLIYLTLEQVLLARTDLLLFESDYARTVHAAKIGEAGRVPVRIVHNGVTAAEFEPVARAAIATDIVFVGELRLLKGVDILLRALAGLPDVTATIVGDGPDRAQFEALAAELGIASRVSFPGALPARSAFALGRLLVVPSRAESLPYIVLEAAAAGLPMIATRVGGIPEILGPDAGELVAPDDVEALRRAIAARLAAIAVGPDGLTTRLRVRIRDGFSLETMTAGILGAYAAMARQGPPARAAA